MPRLFFLLVPAATLAACDTASSDDLDASVVQLQAQLDAQSVTIAELESALADEIAARQAADSNLEGEIAAVTGGIDLTQLDASVSANGDAIAAISKDYLVLADLDGYATEAWVGSQGYASDSAVSANTAAISAITDDYLTSSDLGGLEDLADYLSVDASTDAVVFTGANVFIQSGSGATDDNGTSTGLGNLIVGYDESNSDTKTGAHNVVVGAYHTYTTTGGMVVGYDHNITGEQAVAVGGRYNEASGEYSATFGGYSNEATGSHSAALGGGQNIASDSYGAVSGGAYNTASGYGASISGGIFNSATSNYSSILGGVYNVASSYGTTVYGGYENTASGSYNYAP